MKIVCQKAVLSEACQNVQRAVSNKTSIPAIEGILFNAANEKLMLTGYDLEVGMRTTVDAKVEKEGGIVINAKLICEILRKLPDEKVVIESDERDIVEIRSGVSVFQIVGIREEDYPELPSVSGCEPIVIPGNILRNMVRQTIYAVSTSDQRPVYTGVLFDIEKGKISLAATDGFRLAVRNEIIDYNSDALSFIVPSKALSEVSKLFDGDETQVQIGVGKRQIIFEINGYKIVSRLLAGEFLDYKSTIPQNPVTNLRVSTRGFIESVERAGIVITDKAKTALRCVFSEDIIKFSCNTAIGKSSDQLKADIKGERLEIGFSNKYLLDALHSAETDEVKVELFGNLAPMKIIPPEGDNFIYLVLPVRLKND